MVSNINYNYTINEDEYAYNLEDISDFKGGKKVKVYVPSLMPEIDTSIEKLITKHIYTESILINDILCKPNIDRRITFDYYIEATIKFNSNPVHIMNEKGIIPKWTRFRCKFIEGDINNCYIDTDL